jgi:hypothetical protein
MWASLAAGTLAALTVARAMSTRSLIVGSIEGFSFYPYVDFFGYRSLRVWLIAMIAAGGLLAVPEGIERRHEWLTVSAWVLLGFGVQVLLRAALTPVAIAPMFVSDTSNSFYSVTLHYPAASVLRDFDRLRVSWPIHAQSNMPGKLMLIYALEFLSGRPDVLAWLVVLLSSLGGALMYLFVRDLFADRMTGLFSMILYLVTPAKLLFLPLMNTVPPVVVLACAVAFLRWLQGGRLVYAVLLGAGLYALVFFEPTALSMGLLFAVLMARELARGSISWRTLLRQSAAVLLAFAVVAEAFRVFAGFDLFDAARRIVSSGLAYNREEGRPYWLWVRQNPLDFFFGVGLCQSIVLLAALAETFTGPAGWRERITRPMTALGMGLVGVLIALDFIGVNRGEVLRLWIFLACVFQIPAAYVCARLRSRPALMLIVATTLLQDALAASLIGFIGP